MHRSAATQQCPPLHDALDYYSFAKLENNHHNKIKKGSLTQSQPYHSLVRQSGATLTEPWHRKVRGVQAGCLEGDRGGGTTFG
jgi:hypothetical protein